MTKKTAVIGAGWFGRAHARVYDEISNLTALCDLNKETLDAVAKRYNINGYTDYKVMLKEEALDAISIATPPFEMPKIAIACAKTGLDILLEKPLANAVGDLTPLKAYVDSQRIMPGHLELFNPVVDELVNRINEIGTPICVSSRRIGLYPRRQWGIGVMHDLGYHEIYIQRRLFGEPRGVQSLMRRFKNDQEDSALVLLKFENDVHGLIEANWLTPTKFRQLTVYGSDGAITIDYITQEIISIQADSKGVNRVEKSVRPYSPQEPLKRELEAFLNAAEAPVTLDDGIQTLETTLAAIRSQK